MMEKHVLIELIKEDELKIKAEMARISAISMLTLELNGISKEKIDEIRKGINACNQYLDDALSHLAGAKAEVLKW